MLSSRYRLLVAAAAFAVSASAYADSVTFTWVPFNNGGATNNGVACQPVGCPPSGTLVLTSAAIDSSWAALVGATSGAPGVKSIAGSAGNYSTLAAIQASGLASFNFSWNNNPNVAVLALGPTGNLANVQVGGGGWTAQYNSTANAYILFNTVTFNGGGAAGTGLQVSDNGITGAASMTNASYSSFGLQDYGYWKLTSYSPTPAVPLPAAGWLLASALGGLSMLRRRREAA